MTMKCPRCGRSVSVPEGAQGRPVKCPHCQRTKGNPGAEGAPLKQGAVLPGAEGAPLKQGAILGRYRIERLIGRGELAAVYRATEVRTGGAVALKVFAPRLARSKPFVERLGREVEALAKLSHPNLVGVLGDGLQGEICYIAVEYVEGESLRARLRRQGPLRCGEAVRLVDQVAAGLEHAHSRGVLHRDIRPENVFVASDGTAKLADFGLTRCAADPGEEGGATRSRPRPSPYLAPEVARGDLLVDHRADVYALGVLLHEMLTGEPPVGRFAPASQAAQDVPQGVDALINAAMAAEPEQRLRDVSEFRSVLQRVMAPPASVGGGTGLLAHLGSLSPRKLQIAAWCGAAVIAIGIVAWLAQAYLPDLVSPEKKPSRESAIAKADSPVPPKRGPTAAEKREKDAGELLELAQRKVRQDNWSAALELLVGLTAKYSDTEVCSANKETIRDLRERALAEVKSRAAQFQAKTGVELPTKAGAEEVPQGLLAVFYDGDDFGQFVRVKRHPYPSFTWGVDNPGGAVTGEHMSARFVGQLEVREPGRYTFHFVSEGGTRLYLDGRKLLDDWSASNHRYRCVALEPGKYPIWIEFKTGGAKASFALHWSRKEFETQVPGDQLSWIPELWRRVCQEPAHDPLTGMKPGPAEPPEAAPPKVTLPANATFESALAYADTRLELKDYRALQKSVQLALQLRPPGDESKPQLDDLFARLVDAAITAGKALETENARTLLSIAQKVRYKSQEIEAVSSWLTKSSETLLVEDFDTGGLARWEIGAGKWRVQDGHLICTASAQEGRILLKKAMMPEYTFGFYVLPGGGAGASHVGGIVRDSVFRRILFSIHDETSAFIAGGEGFFDGIGVPYIRDQGHYAAEPGKTLHVAIRCLALNFECYVDGDLWARGATRDAENGKVGLLAQGAETRFHGVRLYKVYPVPSINLGPKGER